MYLFEKEIDRGVMRVCVLLGSLPTYLPRYVCVRVYLSILNQPICSSRLVDNLSMCLHFIYSHFLFLSVSPFVRLCFKCADDRAVNWTD